MNLQCNFGQGFGGNAVESYKAGGLLGHTGVDNFCGYGTPIKCYHNKAYVYKVLNKQNPANDGTGFTGVFTIVDNGIEVFEFLYGHCDPTVTIGQTLKLGEALGTEANNGEVYAGTSLTGYTRITLDMQKAGDTRGAHRHDQKRILKKTKTIEQGQYLTALGGGLYQDNDGYYYKIPYWTNGYNGCVNWLLPLLNRDLFVGCRGYDVECLQNFLRIQGFFKNETTGYFGMVTKNAVSAFQKAHGINPTLGYVGKITRALINQIIG